MDSQRPVEHYKYYILESYSIPWWNYNRLQFLVSWKGYGREENMWVDEQNLHAEDLVKEFYQENPYASRRIATIQQHFTRMLISRRGGDVREPPFHAIVNAPPRRLALCQHTMKHVNLQ